MLRTVVLGMSITAAAVSVGAADWPQWRGPDGTGHAGDAAPPVRWSASDNVAWRAPLAGLGVSSPIAAGGRIFVTSQIGGGVRRPGNHPWLARGEEGAGERALGRPGAAPPPDDRTFFFVEAFDAAGGRRVWAHRFEAKGPFPAVHDKHNMASPSPVTDGERVYAWFGTGQIVALDVDGRLVWERHLGEEIAPFEINWGHGSSPALYEDLLILLCDHATRSYLLAVDTRTGRERWRVDRGTGRASYSTPVVVQTAAGPELVVNSSERVDAYDPRTGVFLWHVGDANRFPVPSPVFHDAMLYMSRGFRSGPYMAVRPGGRGDVSGSHVAWEVATGAPYVSSLVYDGGLIYMATDAGILTAVDARTGDRVWQERVGGAFSASPVAAGGHVYFASEAGTTFVVRSGAAPRIVARNDLGERLIASPAVAGGRIFLRTDDHLYCIGAEPS